MGSDYTLRTINTFHVEFDQNGEVSHYAQLKITGYCTADSFENVHNSILGI